MTGLIVPEKALRWGIFAGFALLLATPFVITPGTIYPFVVGKALWSRSLIEIVFALWVVLALARPAYRTPRSWLLLLLAVGLAVSLLAAGTGVSLQRSLWSSYERMQGVLDAAHWAALVLVLASMLRSFTAWKTLLGLNAGVGTSMACLIIARHYQLDIPFYGAILESHLPRMSGPFGNPTYLAVYMLFNLVLAFGFAVLAWLPHAAPAAGPTPRRRDRHQHRKALAWPRLRWIGALPWLAAAALLLWGLSLAGSVGGFVGLFAAIAFVALGYATLTRGRRRWIAFAVLAVLGLSAVGIGLRVVNADRTAGPDIGNPIAEYVISVHIQRPGVQSRLEAWKAGLEGFLARPVLGWGPENFGTVFGRYASGYGTVIEPHDYAHSKLVEVVATTGALGLLAWLALWVSAFLVLWRAVRVLEARERALAVFAGAALFGGLVQSLLLFDTVVGMLQSMLLLGFAVSLEATAVPEHRRPRMPSLLRGAKARLAAAVVAVALAASGLTVNHAIHSAADRNHIPLGDWPWQRMEGGIDGFEPLANTWRRLLFNEVGQHWPRIRDRDGARSLQLLEWVEREAADALRAEPTNWQIHHSLTRMYDAATKTDPGHAAKARSHLERGRALAPNRPAYTRVPQPPGELTVRRLEDGRHELRWRWSEGAGYVTVSESQNHGPWRHILHVYDPARTSFVPTGSDTPGIWRYRVKACLFPGACSNKTLWPPIVVPAEGANRSSTP